MMFALDRDVRHENTAEILDLLSHFSCREDVIAWGFTQRPVRNVIELTWDERHVVVVIPFDRETFLGLVFADEGLVSAGVYARFPSQSELETLCSRAA